MPVAPWIQDILEQRYRQLGMAVPRHIASRATQGMQVPQATSGFPDIPTETFRQQEIARRTDTTGWEWITNPLMWIGRALGAGEYGVASMFRSIIKNVKGEETLDPFSSFVRGVRAGFADDPKFQTRITDVITELGWDPEAGTAESWTKEIIGFLGGIVLDPLTYASFGASAAGRRVGEAAMRKGAKRLGIELPKKIAKGQVTSKLGTKALEEMRDKSLSSIMRRPIAEGALFDATMRAERHAMNDLVRAVMPMWGVSWQEQVAKKGTGLIDYLTGFLRKSGKTTLREGTDEARKWFVEAGFKKLLDQGGLKIFGKSLIAGDFLMPRTSGLVGLVIGDALRVNLPVSARMIDTVRSTRAWRTIVSEPLSLMGDTLKKMFVAGAGLDDVTRGLVRKMYTAGPVANETGKHIIGSLVSAADEDLLIKRLVRTPAGLKEVVLNVPSGTASVLDTQQQRLLSRLLHDADAKKISENFSDWVKRDTRKEYRHWLKDLHIQDISDKELAQIGEVGERIQNFWQNLRKFEQEIGIGNERVREAYMPHLWVNRPKKLTAEHKAIMAKHDWFNRERIFGNVEDTWDTLANRKDLPGRLSDNLVENMHARIAATFRESIEQDVLDQLAQHTARLPGARKALASVLEKQPNLLSEYPDLALILAEGAEAGVTTLPKQTAKYLDEVIDKLSVAKTGNEIDELLDAFKSPRVLEDGNIDQFMGRYRNTIRELEEVIATNEGLASAGRMADLKSKLAVLKSRHGELYGRLQMANTQRHFRQTYNAIAKEARKDVFDKFPAAGLARQVQELTGFQRGVLADLSTGDVRSKAAQWIDQVTQGVPTPKAAKAWEGLPQAQRQAAKAAAARARVSARQELRKFAREVQNYRTAVDDFHATVAKIKGGKLPASEIREASRRAQITKLSLYQARDQVDEGLRALVRADKLGPLQAGDAAVLMAKHRTLTQLMKKAPSEDLLKKLAKADDSLVKHTQRLEAIRSSARAAGVSDRLPAIVSRVGKGRTLESVSDDGLGQIEQLLRKKSPGHKYSEAVQDFLLPEEDYVKGTAIANRLVAHPVTGERVSAGKLYFSKRALEAIGDVIRPKDLDDSVLGVFGHAIDTITNPLKRLLTAEVVPGVMRPAFFARNAVDMFFRRALAMGAAFFNPNSWKLRSAWDILAGKDGDILLGGVNYTYKQVREFMKASGIWRHEFARIGVGSNEPLMRMLRNYDDGLYISARAAKDKISGAIDSVPLLRHVAGKGPNRFGTGMENLPMIEQFLSMLDRKIPVDETIDRLSHFFFDYNNLTKFERGVARRTFLFYGFSRQAIPFAWQELKRHPWTYGAVGRLRDLAFDTKEQEALVPDWVRDYPLVGMDHDKKKLRVWSLRNVFTIDVLPEYIPTKIPELIGQINPFLAIIPELQMGREAYQFRTIPRDKILRNELSQFALKTFGPFVGHREGELNGKKVDIVDGYKWHALNRLWFSRFFRDLDTVWQTIEGKKPLQDSLMQLGLGVKVTEYDIERQKNFLEADARKAKSEYTSALKRGDKYRAAQIIEELRVK